MIKELIEAHKFFVRKSQHYVLGNWKQYYNPWHTEGWNEKHEETLKYYNKNYLKAYFKFMGYTVRDYFRHCL